MSRKENNQSQQTYDIYVGNVPKKLSEIELRQVFIKYGEIKQILCRWKDDYAEIGYAIVKFVYKADAENLLRETEEVSWNGHPLPVKAARRSDHSQHNGNSTTEQSKAVCFPDLKSKPVLMNPSFLKGVSSFYCPGPLANNHIKRNPADFHQMPEIGYFHYFKEAQNIYSVPQNLEVICTNAEDAITFHGCPVSRHDELVNLRMALNSLDFSQKRTDKKLLPKKVYAANYSEDKSWYRCIVTRTSIQNKPGVCTVNYIDYGNQEDIAYKSVVELPEPLQKVPPFASKFVLLNLTCESKANKQTYLHQLVNKRMSLVAVRSPDNNEYQVLKCSCNGKDVVSETIKKGFASFKELPSKTKSHIEPVENEMNKATVYNGVNGYHEEMHGNIITHENSNNNKKSRKIVSKSKDNSPVTEDINYKENAENPDFHPKMIIKRGSDLTGIVGAKNPTESKKEEMVKQQCSSITIDTVLSNLKLINNIRALVSQSSDDSIIQCAVKTLQSELKTLEISEKLTNCINEAFEKYTQSLNKIKDCKDKDQVYDLKMERDSNRNVLCDSLKTFLENFDTSIFERKEKIMQIIIDLASNSNDWMNVELKSKPSDLEELILEYDKVKEEKWNIVRKAREKTNEKHRVFMGILKNLEKEFYLNTLEEDNKCDSLSINNEGKRKSYSDKFNEALKDLGETVEEEIHTLTLNKSRNSVSIIECLLAELDIHKEKVEFFCQLYESKQKIFNDLAKIIDPESLIQQLSTVQEGVCSSLLRLMHFENSKEGNSIPNFSVEYPLVVRDLHAALLEEDSIIENLAKAAETSLPELCIECTEIKLSEYIQSKYLMKYSWKPEYFVNLEKISRGNNSFVSKLLDTSIVIKEYKHETNEELENFLQTCFRWNECKTDFLLKITALFFKEENVICVIIPLIRTSLLDNPPMPMPGEGIKACNILKQVLIALQDLHSKGLIYGAIHPAAVLIKETKVLLDFCFNPKALEGNTILKGINFASSADEANKESGDMYGFGCLVLWLLFTNLSFTSTDEGVPNLEAFRSIIEEALTTKDYLILVSLLSPKSISRPSASYLLSKGFLSNYEIYCRSRNKTMNNL